MEREHARLMRELRNLALKGTALRTETGSDFPAHDEFASRLRNAVQTVAIKAGGWN
jgi:hypothetical protein